jgi:hypothetical protein
MSEFKYASLNYSKCLSEQVLNDNLIVISINVRINKSVKNSDGKLEGDEESPKRARLKRSKSRHLLERLRNYDHVEMPFTNNQGE